MFPTGIVGVRAEVPMPSDRASQDGVSDFCTGPTIRCSVKDALAYLSDGSGKLVMPRGIKKARMTSRANEAGRKD
jgi:hypothetical protein